MMNDELKTTGVHSSFIIHHFRLAEAVGVEPTETVSVSRGLSRAVAVPLGETSGGCGEGRKVRESNPPECFSPRFSGPLGLPRAEPSVTGAPGFEPRSGGFGVHHVAGYTTLLKLFANDAGGRTRTSEVTGTPDLQSGAFAAQPRPQILTD